MISYGIFKLNKPHIILTLGRSGSNTLVDMLNQHPAILNYGEVLGDWNRIRQIQQRLAIYRDNDQAYLDAILDSRFLLKVANARRSISKLARGRGREVKWINKLQTVGFKEFSLNFHRCGLRYYIGARKDAKIIALTRSNIIERMISNEVLQATGIVSSRTRGAQVPRPKLAITPEAAIKKLIVIEEEAIQLEEMITDVDQERVFRVDYADLYADPDRTVDTVRQVYEFLGVPDLEPSVRMTKIVRGDPLALLENADEIRSTIERTRFAKFLC